MDTLKLTGRVDTYNNIEQSDGLSLVDYIDYSSGSYEFDYRAVWKDKEGRLWTARDSGCSCPSPFEDTQELDRLWNVKFLQDEFDEAKSSYPSLQDFAAFKAKVESAFEDLKIRKDPFHRLNEIVKTLRK
jgi:hypothetical protein